MIGPNPNLLFGTAWFWTLPEVHEAQKEIDVRNAELRQLIGPPSLKGNKNETPDSPDHCLTNSNGCDGQRRVQSGIGRSFART